MLCLLLLTLFSCSKESAEDLGFQKLEVVSQSQPIKAGDVLMFSDSEDFNTFMKATLKKDVKSLEAYTAGIGFKSLYSKMKDKAAYNSIANGSKISWTVYEDDELVPDPYLASILNHKREVGIGDFIFRITSDGTFMFKPEKRANLESLLQNRSKVTELKQKSRSSKNLYEAEEGLYLMYIENPDDSELPFEPTYDDPYSGGGSGGGGSTGPTILPDKWCSDQGNNVFGKNYTCEQEYASGDRRIKGRFWSLNYGFYATIGTNTRCQNKWAGAWWSENAAYIYAKWDVEYEYQDELGAWWPMRRTGEKPKNNEHEVEETFDINTAYFNYTTSTGATITKQAYNFRIKKGVTNHKLDDHNTKANVNISAQ